MVCCYLLYAGIYRTPQEVLRYYGEQRTKDGKVRPRQPQLGSGNGGGQPGLDSGEPELGGGGTRDGRLWNQCWEMGTRAGGLEQELGNGSQSCGPGNWLTGEPEVGGGAELETGEPELGNWGARAVLHGSRLPVTGQRTLCCF